MALEADRVARCSVGQPDPDDPVAGDELLEGIGDGFLVHGVPDADRVRRLTRAVASVEHRLGDVMYAGGVRTSPLHPGWARDVDVHVRTLPDSDHLREAGWLQIDGFLQRLGSSGSGRWAVIEGDEVLAMAELHLSPPPDPVASVIGRCRRRGEVRLREVLELRALIRRGLELPRNDVVRAAAAAEAALGGELLEGSRGGRPKAPPVRIGSALRGLRRRIGERRRPRLVIAISGVDGAGKSTLIEHLKTDLAALGLPVAAVWARPGMDLGRLGRFAGLVKRLLGHGAEPGVRAAAQGHGAELASRRGLLGWCWSMAVALTFVMVMRRHHRAARGCRIMLCDRHRVDGLVSLELLYAGSNLQIQRALLSWALRPADLTFYLDVPVELAAGRKPDDPFAGVVSLSSQVERYRSELLQLPSRVLVLDAAQAPERIARQALRSVLVDR